MSTQPSILISFHHRPMDKTTKIDALIVNQAKFAEILVHFNGYKSADPAKHAILLEAYNTLKAQRTCNQLEQGEHKIIDKCWDNYWEDMQ